MKTKLNLATRSLFLLMPSDHHDKTRVKRLLSTDKVIICNFLEGYSLVRVGEVEGHIKRFKKPVLTLLLGSDPPPCCWEFGVNQGVFPCAYTHTHTDC